MERPATIQNAALAAPRRIPVTQADCRRRVRLWGAASAGVFGLMLCVHSSHLLPVSTLLLFTALQTAQWLQFQRKVRDGATLEMVEAPAQGVPRIFSILAMSAYTVLAVSASALSLILLINGMLSLIEFCTVAAINIGVWWLAFALWRRALGVANEARLVLTDAPVAAPVPAGGPAPTPSDAGHWWTQNAVREDVRKDAGR